MRNREISHLHKVVYSDDHYGLFQEELKDPNERDVAGVTFLHYAAMTKKNNSRILQLLIDRGADLDATISDGSTPLHLAAIYRTPLAVIALLDAGASVNVKDSKRRTALHYSIRRGDAKYDIEGRDYDIDMDIVDRLLCHPDIIPDPVDENGDTPLMCAVMERNLTAVEALLKKGADPNIPNKDGRTPLHQAVSSPYPPTEIVIALLSSGSGIDRKDRSRVSPIDYIVRNVHDDCSLSFASTCVRLITFRYRISKSLKRKVGRIPALLNYFNDCCEEVRLMKKLIIYDNFTLHDFCLDCFQTRVEDPVREIYVPVVEIFLTGVFTTCNDLILFRLKMQDLLNVLGLAAGMSLDSGADDVSFSKRLETIWHVYNDNALLNEKIQKLKLSLNKLNS